MIERIILAKIKNQCFTNKLILLLGARQVGKATLLKSLVQSVQVKTLWLNTVSQFTQTPSYQETAQGAGASCVHSGD